jgi:hypothetical protein
MEVMLNQQTVRPETYKLSLYQGLRDVTVVSEPYQIMDRIQRKRVVAKTIETPNVYDFSANLH